MREKLFLFVFFTVGAVFIFGAAFLLPQLFNSMFPESSKFLESHSDLIVGLFTVWIVLKSHTVSVSAKLKDIKGDLYSLNARLDRLESSRRA